MRYMDAAKKINKAMPDWAKAALAPVLRRRLTRNRCYLETRARLLQADEATAATALAAQRELLFETLCYAYRHVPFYREAMRKAGVDPRDGGDPMRVLERLPIIDKPLILRRYDEFFSDEPLDAYWTTTSGSTGQGMNILHEKRSIYMEKAFYHHFWARYGYDP
ncbi:MAG TPA: hypothetical protein PKE04_18455, partial [Clostridia bacterium]|nr:hypothetical protein [Clostridia bacterium]